MSADVEPLAEAEQVVAHDRAGRALPDWVTPDHLLAGTLLRPEDPDEPVRRGSVLELWFPVMAMGMAPLALILIRLRSSPTAESAMVGNWAGGALVVAVVLLLVVGRRL